MEMGGGMVEKMYIVVLGIAQYGYLFNCTNLSVRVTLFIVKCSRPRTFVLSAITLKDIIRI